MTKHRYPIARFLSALLILSLLACNSSRDPKPITEALSNFVYAYTSGIISKNATIRVQFAQEVVADEKVGTTLSSSPIRFEPAITGKASWEDRSTLIFEPDEPMNSGTTYLAMVSLDQLFGNLPADAQTFEFDFRTKELYFNVEVVSFQAPDTKDLSKQELIGALQVSDVTPPNKIEQLLTAKQGSKNLSIRWEHTSDDLLHSFFVENIERTEKTGSLTLYWNGRPLNVDLTGEKMVEIPGLSDFIITNVKVYQSPQQYIALHFSDPILTNQDLNGLITIDDYPGELRFSIDGNRVLIYPNNRISGTKKINVFPGLANVNNYKLENKRVWEVSFVEEKPQLRLVSSGTILPNSDGLIFPFEAINLNAVLVEVFKIYNNNVLQFLQNNDLNGDYELEQVGRVVHQEKVDLQVLDPGAITTEWHRYALDLSKLLKKDPKAIYQIRIGFKPGYSNYFCGSNGSMLDNYIEEDETIELNEEGEFESIWRGWYGLYGYYDGYDYDHRENPCFPAYYNNEQFVRRSILSSDLGIIAKKGADQSMFFAVTDLRTAKPVGNAEIKIYDYQQQLIGKTNTDAQGLAQTNVERTPFVAIASLDQQVGYLKLQNGNALSLSRFDISGVAPQKGLKGYVYGERGVWRPGDSLYLHFVLEDKAKSLPTNYPITAEFYDPKGQLIEKRTTAANLNGVYPIFFGTSPEAITGNWRVQVKVGGANFSKTLKIETIKPNRLKIDLDLGTKTLTSSDDPINAKLQVNWLHGAPAQNLRTRVEYQLQPTKTSFPKLNDYVFDDPARDLYSEPMVIFDDQLNATGTANFTANLLQSKVAPGKLKVQFKTRAFEKGGDFSSDNFSVEYLPYSSFVGILMPKDKYNSNRIEVDETGKITMVLVDADGKPINGRKLSVGMYRVNWRWWWDRDQDRLNGYASSNHFNATNKTEVTTNTKGEATWTVKPDQWGRYLVRACDTESGHCTGDFFYAGYPWYDSDEGMPEGAAMLAFSSSKSTYAVGETIELNVPASADSRVLITLENGTKTIESFWREAKAGENTFKFEATKEMAPNVYAHVSLIQPHAQTQNDLPIRMYGVHPIQIEDPTTKLQPQIAMPDQLAPEKEFTVEVSEKSGESMVYTLAVVDEGLLDLTRFKTPNPWDAFFAKEALGVRTFDVYDDVIGAYGGELERLLSVGGDAEAGRPTENEGANRFKPVVLQAGPFTLKAGQKVKHTFTMPNYVGSVRTMLVASKPGAYGAADKTTPVKQPLMLLATLPRVLGPGEQVAVPISVFAGDEKVKDVNVSIKESSGLAELQGATSQRVRFDKLGEKMVYFEVKMAENIGIARFTIEASGNGFKASQEIELDVRNPNPYLTKVLEGQTKAQTNWEITYQPIGMAGTNEVILEVSSLPPIDLGRRLEYLIRYPYGCIEQTTSSGFPQLYVDQLLELNESQKTRVPQNIQATIERLKMFQRQDGAFTYWPGEDGYVSSWSHSYVGQFLLEADALGYQVPKSMLNNWKKYQKATAKDWNLTHAERFNNSYHRGPYYEKLDQAQRLYTLALAKDPDWGAMNRLREAKELPNLVRWKLAAAYAIGGQKETALKLIENASTEAPAYFELGGSFGSDLRDAALILETLTLLELETKAAEVARAVAESLNKEGWYNTQGIGYGLMALGKYVKRFNPAGEVAFEYQLGSQPPIRVGSDAPIFQTTLPDVATPVKVVNKTNGLLYTRIIMTGQPLVGDQSAESKNVQLDVAYRDTKGNLIDPSTIPQGTDFVAEVTVTHTGSYPYNIYYEEMALDQIFPSGWEILNARMDGLEFGTNSAKPVYQDYRDDRVYTFYNLPTSQKQTYRIRLNAAYRGRFYLPSIKTQAMYSNQVRAHQPGQWVEVLAPNYQ